MPQMPQMPQDATDDVARPNSPDGVLSAKEVLQAVEASVAFISTDWASGTALSIQDGYLITNAHIITPFDTVDVTPSGGDTIEDVPVVGVDFDSDLALLGPLTDPLPPIPYELDIPVETGDEVYLVGYPSETERSPTATISEGIVSRFRDVLAFDQHFIQTDADIAGGQSGGALVDSHGRVIGISGLSLDEAFALVLDFDDALVRLEGLMAGGQNWTPLANDGVTSADVTIPDTLSSVRLQLLDAPTDEQVSVTLTGEGALDRVAVDVYLDDGTSLSSPLMVAMSAEWEGTSIDEQRAALGEDNIIEPDANGTYTFEMPASFRGFMVLNQVGFGPPLQISVTSNRELTVADDEQSVIGVGGQARGIIEPLETQDRFALDLRAGQSVNVRLESATGDMAFYVLAPGETYGPDSFFVDDSNIGIGGLDAEGVFTAEVDGPHQIILWDIAGQSGYLLTVDPA